jgi:glycosyltransferase involved in cell wall biosynthesis
MVRCAALVSDCLVADPVEGGQTLAAQIHAEQGPWGVVLCGVATSRAGWEPVLDASPTRWRAWRQLRRAGADQVTLLPDGGFSFAVLLHLWLIRLWLPRAQMRLYVLQTFREPRFLRLLASRLTVVALNEADAATFRACGVPTEVMPTPDLADRTSDLTRAQARGLLGLDQTGSVFLHVGHATAGRNLHALAPLAEHGMLVLVMSPHSPLEVANLPSGPNVRVVHERVEIGHYYRASDVYVFPTVDTGSVIGIPMSIAEARSNGIPVVARRSSLTQRWDGEDQVTLVDTDDDLVASALRNSTTSVV